MKQKIYLVLMFIILLIPISVKADGTDKFYLDVYVNEDGSATFKELIVFSGSYNYLERRLYYQGNSKPFGGDSADDFYGTDIYNASGISNICASEVNMSNAKVWDYSNYKGNCFKYKANPSNGMSGYYTNYTGSNGEIIRIYNHSSRNTAFYLEYDG